MARRRAHDCWRTCARDRAAERPPSGRPGGFAHLTDGVVFGASDGTEVGVWKLDLPSTIHGASVERFGARCDSCLTSRDLSLIPFDATRALIGSPDGFAISDGTVAGTHLLSVARLSPTRTGTVRVGERLLLAASDLRGLEPWTTEGSASGTEILADLLRDDASSAPSDPLAFADEVVFTASDGAAVGDWRTDGTTDGTRRLGEGGVGDPWAAVFERRRLGDRLLLLSNTEDGFAIWATADLDAAPERVTPFSPPPPPIGPPGPPPLRLTDAAETAAGLVFCQDGTTLRVTDGTVAGSNALEAAPWSSCGSFLSLGDTALFRAIGLGESTTRLWRTDGSLAGTRLVTVPGGGALEGSFSGQVEVDGFAVVTRLADAGAELWSISPAGLANRIAGPFDATLVRVIGIVGDTLLVGVGTSAGDALLGLRLDGQSGAADRGRVGLRGPLASVHRRCIEPRALCARGPFGRGGRLDLADRRYAGWHPARVDR